ncbi:MAG: ATP-dependent zinc metalloprotease FtsH [Oligoflexia bacterium]|nr:ATP-dependent zinc metalloprotease FtsH [Oligoflexia bacterium]MBF0364953.1 ATP-dependent zinc metalloprotease FtsH [Oligoflexia bacterium]
MKQQHKTIALWFVVILLMALTVKVFDQRHGRNEIITYSEFVDAVEKKLVQEVTFKGQSQKISGKFKTDFKNGSAFQLVGSTGKETFDILRSNGITPNYDEEDRPSMLTTILINWGPMILLILIFYFFLRQIQAGGGKAMSFGKSRARLLNESDKKINFSHVAGVDEAKEELVEIVDFLKDPKKYTTLGGKIPKGVLLIGPPGTGKTLLAKAVAGEAEVPFFSISGSDFVEMFVGVGASRVRDLFEQGKKHAPCIIFVDEIDAVGRHRGAGLGGGHDEREQTLNQLLVEMDGFETNSGVILIAATNRVDVLDPALLRPGRFDRRVVVPRPDVRGRLEILKVHTRETPVCPDVNLESIAKGTPGFTGADLANLVNEAALQAARENKKKLALIDFEMAKDKVIMGVARKSMVISESEKRNTAYHEAGHAIVGINLPKTDPVHKVTIIPRGMALGVTQTLPEEDILNLSSERAHNFISFLMGGRCAEEIIFGEKTNGASNDIERATDIARSMVCQWGMSELGPVAYGKNKEHPFAGMGADVAEYSDDTARKIDIEVHRIIGKNYQIAMDILVKNREALVRVSEALVIWETLDRKQIEELLAGRDIGVPIGPKGGHRAQSTQSSEDDCKAGAAAAAPTPTNENSPAPTTASSEPQPGE